MTPISVVGRGVMPPNQVGGSSKPASWTPLTLVAAIAVATSS